MAARPARSSARRSRKPPGRLAWLGDARRRARAHRGRLRRRRRARRGERGARALLTSEWGGAGVERVALRAAPEPAGTEPATSPEPESPSPSEERRHRLVRPSRWSGRPSQRRRRRWAERRPASPFRSGPSRARMRRVRCAGSSRPRGTTPSCRLERPRATGAGACASGPSGAGRARSARRRDSSSATGSRRGSSRSKAEADVRWIVTGRSGTARPLSRASARGGVRACRCVRHRRGVRARRGRSRRCRCTRAQHRGLGARRGRRARERRSLHRRRCLRERSRDGHGRERDGAGSARGGRGACGGALRPCLHRLRLRWPQRGAVRRGRSDRSDLGLRAHEARGRGARPGTPVPRRSPFARAGCSDRGRTSWGRSCDRPASVAAARLLDRCGWSTTSAAVRPAPTTSPPASAGSSRSERRGSSTCATRAPSRGGTSPGRSWTRRGTRTSRSSADGRPISASPHRAPAFSVLDCARGAGLGVRLRPWREALVDYLAGPDSPLAPSPSHGPSPRGDPLMSASIPRERIRNFCIVGAHRSRQEHARRPAARRDALAHAAREARAVPRQHGARARARHHDQGADGAPSLHRRGRRDVHPQPDRHTRTRRLLVRGLGEHSPRARGPFSSWMPRRGSRHRRSRTRIWRSTRTSRSSLS